MQQSVECDRGRALNFSSIGSHEEDPRSRGALAGSQSSIKSNGRASQPQEML